jgi:hypothetical protein
MQQYYRTPFSRQESTRQGTSIYVRNTDVPEVVMDIFLREFRASLQKQGLYVVGADDGESAASPHWGVPPSPLRRSKLDDV